MDKEGQVNFTEWSLGLVSQLPLGSGVWVVQGWKSVGQLKSVMNGDICKEKSTVIEQKCNLSLLIFSSILSLAAWREALLSQTVLRRPLWA